MIYLQNLNQIEDVYMGFRNDVSRLLKVATKPDRKEIWLVIRVTAVGMGLLGLLGFLIKLAGDSIFKLSS